MVFGLVLALLPSSASALASYDMTSPTVGSTVYELEFTRFPTTLNADVTVKNITSLFMRIEVDIWYFGVIHHGSFQTIVFGGGSNLVSFQLPGVPSITHYLGTQYGSTWSDVGCGAGLGYAFVLN